MRATRRRGLVVAAVLAILTLGTITTASAYWRGGGGGSGSGATGTTLALTLSPATATAQLFPGGQSAVVLSIANPNPGTIRVGSLVLEPTQGTGGFAVDGAHSGCVLSTLSFTTQTNAGAGWTVAGSGNLSVTLSNALSMTAGAANACQGASFTIYLAAGP
jgi:hypothetical protein